MQIDVCGQSVTEDFAAMSNGTRDGAVVPHLHLAGLVCLATIASASAHSAAAEPAQTTWTTYLYQGPGPHYAVVDEVPQASALDLGACENGWCRATIGGRVGFLRASVVAKGDAAHPTAGVLAQPAADLTPVRPNGPCFKANQTGGNGGNAMTVFCEKK